ncbi:MAG TPA: hypothetical protein VLT36_20295, partial [Candidatus Dormibacteraeota bacterium]|nr:hypothetical protein [Candidatus Dormibacteraeota bacterium]
MSLMRLLEASQSWMGMSREESRFRMGDPRSMPKFGNSEHPFQKKNAAAAQVQAAEPQDLNLKLDQQSGVRALVPPVSGLEESVGTQVPPAIPVETVNRAELCESQRKVCVVADSGRRSDSLRLPQFRTETAPVVGQASSLSPVGEVDVRSGANPETSRRPVRRGWWSNLWRSGERAAKEQAAARGPVQGELSLEKVQVVRNDLSDTDLEIVRKESAARPEAVMMAKDRFAEAGGEKSWGRMTNLFSARK